MLLFEKIKAVSVCNLTMEGISEIVQNLIKCLISAKSEAITICSNHQTANTQSEHININSPRRKQVF